MSMKFDLTLDSGQSSNILKKMIFSKQVLDAVMMFTNNLLIYEFVNFIIVPLKSIMFYTV